MIPTFLAKLASVNKAVNSRKTKTDIILHFTKKIPHIPAFN